jgi:hypothetical protein
MADGGNTAAGLRIPVALAPVVSATAAGVQPAGKRGWCRLLGPVSGQRREGDLPPGTME